MQVPELATAESIFTEYAYLSSVSTTWVAHYARTAESLSSMLGLTTTDLVIEIASNDGGLLRFFKDRGIQVLGVEPATNVADESKAADARTSACRTKVRPMSQTS